MNEVSWLCVMFKYCFTFLGLKATDNISIRSASSANSLLNLASYPAATSTSLLKPAETKVRNGKKIEYGRGDTNFSLRSGKQSPSPSSSPRSGSHDSMSRIKIKTSPRLQPKQHGIVTLDLHERGETYCSILNFGSL